MARYWIRQSFNGASRRPTCQHRSRQWFSFVRTVFGQHFKGKARTPFRNGRERACLKSSLAPVRILWVRPEKMCQGPAILVAQPNVSLGLASSPALAGLHASHAGVPIPRRKADFEGLKTELWRARSCPPRDICRTGNILPTFPSWSASWGFAVRQIGRFFKCPLSSGQNGARSIFCVPDGQWVSDFPTSCGEGGYVAKCPLVASVSAELWACFLTGWPT